MMLGSGSKSIESTSIGFKTGLRRCEALIRIGRVVTAHSGHPLQKLVKGLAVAAVYEKYQARPRIARIFYANFDLGKVEGQAELKG